MKHRLGRAGIILIFAVSSFAVSGCFESDGESGGDGINDAPSISGSPPPAVIVGDNYSFTPTATDPDGDPLNFSIQNRPNWLDFNPANGNLSGVATLGNEGRYEEITITVSDGDKSASLGPFSIEITQAGLGSATLSWTPPTENTDGTPLVDLAAYKIYYGTTEGIYPNSIRIDNPGIASYVVNNLVPNTYYFVATSVNAAGIESTYSNVATKVVNAM